MTPAAQPERREHNSEGGFPDIAPPSSNEPGVDAVVKWFKSDKGFGFVELGNGTGDAFLHIGAVQAAGYEALPPGAKLKVQVDQLGQGPAGLARAGGRPRRRRGARRRRRRVRWIWRRLRPSAAPSGPGSVDSRSGSGKVKWFDETKGFGFVQSNDGGKDVFVHISILGPSGVNHLAEGQPVTMQVVDTAKRPRSAVDHAVE